MGATSKARLLVIVMAGVLALVGCGKRTTYRLGHLVRVVRLTQLFGPKQLEGMQFDVTLFDKETRNPVPFAILVLRSTVTSETLKADGAGSLQLVLTKARLTQNPELLASKDGIALGVSARLFGVMQSSGPKPALVDISDYSARSSDSLAVLYQKHDSALADSVLVVLQEQRAYIKKNLPLPTIPWGVVLVDSPPPFQLVQTSRQHAGVDYLLFPYWTGDWRAVMYRINFERFAKTCLFAAVQLPDEMTALWLFNGLPGYWAARHLADRKSDPHRPGGPLLYSDSSWTWLESLFRARRGKPLNLLRWKPGGPEDWLLASEFFRAFWAMVAEQYGDGAIAGYIRELSGVPTPTPKLCRATLLRHTGPEVMEALAAFLPDSAWCHVSQLRRATDAP